MKKYKVVDGVSFYEGTNEIVVSILLDAIARRDRIRIFYGDVESGKDWCETYDTIGTVGLSCGTEKIPLIIHSTRSMGGDAILTENIVKITRNKKVIYQQHNYNCNVSINENGNVVSNGNEVIFLHGNDPMKAQRFLSFLKGERNSY